MRMADCDHHYDRVIFPAFSYARVTASDAVHSVATITTTNNNIIVIIKATHRRHHHHRG